MLKSKYAPFIRGVRLTVISWKISILSRLSKLKYDASNHLKSILKFVWYNSCE